MFQTCVRRISTPYKPHHVPFKMTNITALDLAEDVADSMGFTHWWVLLGVAMLIIVCIVWARLRECGENLCCLFGMCARAARCCCGGTPNDC